MPTITLPPLPYPNPAPIPWPVPRPTPEPTPGTTTPEPVPGVPFPMPSPIPGGGAFLQPFTNLFAFDVDWRLIIAIIILALTVDLMAQQNESVAWGYAGILLLGAIVITGRFRNFTSEFDALTRALGY